MIMFADFKAACAPLFNGADRCIILLSQPPRYSLRVRVIADDACEPPWEMSDCPGSVTGWVTRAKQPGELLLNRDHGSARYYDYAGAIAIAKRDGWGCGDDTHAHATAGERTACAVQRDYEYLRAWCNNEWHYVGVEVAELCEHGGEVWTDSIWGIESESHDYIIQTAYDLLRCNGSEQIALKGGE